MPYKEESSSKFRHSVATKFFVLVLLTATLVTTVTSSIRLYSDYNESVQDIGSLLLEIKESYLEAMTSYAWVANNEILQTQLNGIAKLPNIQFLELNINESLKFTAGKSESSYDMTHEYPLVYKYRGEDITLGSLQINISLDSIKDSLFNSAVNILLVLVITIFVVSGLIISLFNILIGKHLNKMVQYTKTLNMKKLDYPLSLDRSGILNNSQDELYHLSTSINRMRERLIADICEHEQAEKTFQAIVQSTVGITGQDLFDNVCTQLCNICDSGCAIVGELIDTDNVNTITMVLDGKFIRDFSYRLPGTPCEDVVVRGFCHYSDDIRLRFPDDKNLQDLQAVGYAGTPLKDQSGSVIGVLCIISKEKMILPERVKDLMNILAARTSAEIERMRAEKEKIKLVNHLQQAQKMEAIGTLAGGIAHDFNNILAAILGYAEMARDDSPPESTAAEGLDKVLEGGNRAKDLVQQILAFSRQDEIERIPLQPANVVEKVVKMLRPSLPTTIEINQDITSVTGLILADPTQIHQILMNLCTNAFHAMEETGGKLGISLKEVSLSTEDLVHEPTIEPGTFIQLSISDSGPGIAPDIKKKIFDPYFTTKDTGKGTGMGLAIVHGIVKSYGGFISLYSEPGEGTAFHVLLPVIEEELPPEIEDVEPIPLGRDRILFIDDEEMLTEMGKSMLERLGYHVTVRNNSIEALETFKIQPDLFDLVITDQTMPGMTGADIARRMIQIRHDIPIILCTGYSTVISEEKAKSMGIKEFALKPLSKKDIAVLIRKVLDSS